MGGRSTGSRSSRAARAAASPAGRSAVDGGIVVSLERMRAIEIDTDCRVAVVEPGAFNAEVKAAAAEHGLWYPPDPSSYEICSIGGNVATNAGGLCCVKYGVTTDYVLGLDVVLADGTLVTLGGKRIKDVAGLSLLKLFVGSEGTLGIVTRAILRLVPSAGGAVDPGRVVRRRGRGGPGGGRGRPVDPPVDDGADGPRLDQRRRGLPADGARPQRRGAAGRAVRRPRRGSRPRGRGDAEGLRGRRRDRGLRHRRRRGGGDVRRGAAGGVPRASRQRGTLLLEDVGAPIPLLPELLAAIAAIAAKHDIEIPVVAHAGDGNTHPIIVYDAGDPASEERARQAFDEVMHAAIALGGTITGEHGVGRDQEGAPCPTSSAPT